MTGPLLPSVKRRAVFLIGGYDPKSQQVFFNRINREAGRFEALWDVDLQHSTIEELEGDIARVTYTARGTGPDGPWETICDFNHLSLDRIVLGDFARPFPVRLGRYLVTFFDYVFSGTALQFCVHAWRFFIYFLYPFVLIALAFALSATLAALVLSANIQFAWLAALATFLIAFLACVKLGGKRFHVLHLMDLWSFSRDFLRRSRPDMEDALDRYARRIATAAQADYDEILLIGHSTGGALILDAAARAHVALGKDHTPLTILTVGSTALKVGLHPAAGWFRAQTANMLADPKVHWVEYQCLTDIINFYDTDPVRLMGIEPRNQPLIGRIKIRRMVDAATYRRIRRNFFRVHYQFVYGNTRKYHYDFPAIVFGPARVIDRARKAHEIQVAHHENPDAPMIP